MSVTENFEIVKLDEFAGSGTVIYSILIRGEDETFYDWFLAEYNEIFPEEVKDIVARAILDGEIWWQGDGLAGQLIFNEGE